MNKIKVYELSKEIKEDSKDVRFLLNFFNINIENDMSVITEKDASKVKAYFSTKDIDKQNIEFNILKDIIKYNFIDEALKYLTKKNINYLDIRYFLRISMKHRDSHHNVVTLREYCNQQDKRNIKVTCLMDAIDIINELANICNNLYVLSKDFNNNKYFLKERFNLDKIVSITHGIIHNDNYSVVNIKSITDLLSIIKNIELESDERLLYRGQNLVNLRLTPSLFREERYRKKEKHIYNELIINSYTNFEKASSKVECLVKMQHYGLPTRMLDITMNPLVGLYFACSSNEINLYHAGELIIFNVTDDEIYYPKDELPNIIATIPLLGEKEKKSLYNSIIKNDMNKYREALKPLKYYLDNYFIEEEIEMNDLLKNIFFMANKDDARIIKQDGMFILFGLKKKTGKVKKKKTELNLEVKN